MNSTSNDEEPRFNRSLNNCDLLCPRKGRVRYVIHKRSGIFRFLAFNHFWTSYEYLFSVS